MIFTFYSYKGGVGRSMALANVAQWFCQQGLNVLMVDWDLEAPGLEEFFFDRPEELERARAHPGLMDSLLAYKRTYPSIRPQLASAAAESASGAPTLRRQRAARIGELIPPLGDAILTISRAPAKSATSGSPLPATGNEPPAGSLKLLTAGWRAGDHFQEYAAAVQQFDWADFYASFDGEAYFDWLRDALNHEASLVLVDSRTGVTEMGGVCTRHLADVVVCLCAPNRQNLRGLVDMIRSFRRSALIEARGGGLEVVAVPTRIDNSEISLLNQFSTDFSSRLNEFTPAAFKQAQRTFWDLRIPYVPRYAYAEKLAVGVSDTAKDLEQAYQALAAHLMLLAPPLLLDGARPALQSQVKALLPRVPAPVSKRIMLSHTREGQNVARALGDRLKRETSDISLLGVPAMLTAAASPDPLEAVLSQCDAVLAVITDETSTSAFQLRELRTARAKGIRIVTVLGAPENAVALTALPPFLSRYRLLDPSREWDAIVQALRSDDQPSKVPFMAPSLVPNLVAREPEMDRLIRAVAGANETPPPSIAIVGLGGAGKTVLAAAFCHDPRVIAEFFDGILWVTLGPTPDIIGALAMLYAAIGYERPGFFSVYDAAAAFQEALGDRRCLLVVDDVFTESDLQPFLRGGPRCVRVITTRNQEVTREVHETLLLGDLSPQEATAMVRSYLGEKAADERQLLILADRLGRLPLALALFGSMLRDRVRRGETVERALDYGNKALDRRGVTAFDRSDGVSLRQSLDLSLSVLTSEERDQFAMLAAFPKDRAIPLGAVEVLWELDTFETEELAQNLAAKALVSLDLNQRTLTLHPLLREFLRESVKNLAALEERAEELMETGGSSPASP